MKAVNVKVLIPDDVDPKKVIDLSLMVRYQKGNDKWQFVTMPFTLTDSADIEKIRAEIQENLDTCKEFGWEEESCDDVIKAYTEVLEIIDKHIGGKAE